MSARPNCAVCGQRAWMSFTEANVPLCDAHYEAWLAEPSCGAGLIFATMGWDGNITTSSPARVREFQRELGARTRMWANAQSKARTA